VSDAFIIIRHGGQNVRIAVVSITFGLVSVPMVATGLVEG
jgi:hypothetical protein